MHDEDDEDDDTIKNDILRWSDNKLKQWYKDSMMRFEIADIKPHNANIELVHLLFKVYGTLIALTSTMAAEDAAQFLVDHINAVRRSAQKRRQRHESR